MVYVAFEQRVPQAAVQQPHGYLGTARTVQRREALEAPRCLRDRDVLHTLVSSIYAVPPFLIFALLSCIIKDVRQPRARWFGGAARGGSVNCEAPPAKLNGLNEVARQSAVRLNHPHFLENHTLAILQGHTPLRCLLPRHEREEACVR